MRRRPHTLVSARAPAVPAPHRRRRSARRHPAGEDSFFGRPTVVSADSPPTLRWLAPLACSLAGMSAATAIVGLCFRVRTVELAFDPRTVAAAGLAVVALGVRVPQRITQRLCATLWTAISRRTRLAATSPLLPPSGRTLQWLLVSVSMLSAGAGALLLPLLSRWGVGVRTWLERGFVWPIPTSLVMDALIAVMVLAAPLFPLGIALRHLHQLGSVPEQWNSRATCWVLLGAGSMLAVAPTAAVASLPANLLLVAAALPALVIPLLVATAGKVEPGEPDQPAVSTIPPPTERDRWPRLLRAAIVAVGGGGACVACVWHGTLAARGVAGTWLWGVAPLALACGMFAASLRDQLAHRSIAGFGMTTALAGLLTAAGPAVLSVVAIGYAVGYGRGLLWARVADRAIAGAAELTRMLFCIAFTMSVTGPLAIHFFGYRATLQMVALSMTALGGTLVIHDPGHAPRVRRHRVAAVFASLGLMMLLTLLGTPASGR